MPFERERLISAVAPRLWHRNRASPAIFDCGAAQSAGGCILRAWTCSWASVAVGLCRLLRGLMRAASDRHRGHVFGPLAVGLNGRRYFDAQGIDGLPDRRSNRSSGLRYCDLLLASSPQGRFRDDNYGALAGRIDGDRINFTSATARLHDPRRVGPADDRRRSAALASLLAASTSRRRTPQTAYWLSGWKSGT